MPQNEFSFEISLSVLNHLGRNLYRSFATVLGEAISNAWDADATNVWIYVDSKGFWIKDDGIGMAADDFQNKFLKVGYSKRKGGINRTKKGRPFIGRKGIGKLALLSCAEKVTVVTKKKGGKYVGGVIDNRGLDAAITEDLTPQQYRLASWNAKQFSKHTKNHVQGTIIRFDGLKDGVKRSFKFLAKIIALYFRFSLLDKTFKIYLNDKPINEKHLRDLISHTEFLWKIGGYRDPLVQAIEREFSKDPESHEKRIMDVSGITGFLATVEKPRDLKVLTTDERVGVDLFVNGRLREKDILKHSPTARIVESYLYGQIHFDALDDANDRFTSSREGVVADDPKFEQFLKKFNKAIRSVVDEWDELRRKHRREGDPDNDAITKTQRASSGLFNAVAENFESPKGSKKPKGKDKVEKWVDELSGDAAFNFESYAECFISENLVRHYIGDQKVKLSPEAKSKIDQWKAKEKESKNRGNISIEIRRSPNDLCYLSMDDLASLVDKGDKIMEARLIRDAAEFKPMRDAVAHTALLTDPAKRKLETVRENIKGRVKALLLTPPSGPTDSRK